jgi:FkbM family methyltransferase
MQRRVHQQDLEEIRRSVVQRIVADEILPIAHLLQGIADAVVIDAGASIGAWSRAWLDVFGPQTRQLFLFEPQLSSRIHLDGFDLFSATEKFKIEILNQAVAGSSGQRALYTDDPGSALASLYPEFATGWGVHCSAKKVVEATTIDAFAEGRNITHINILKLDIEGAELEALVGAKEMLNRQAIRCVLFEFGSPHVHSRVFFRDIWQLLSSAGYQVSKIGLGDTCNLEPIEHYSYALERHDIVNMFVAHA